MATNPTNVELVNEEDSYRLFHKVFGTREEIPLTIDQYNELLSSREILSDVLSFEEKFFAVCEHFREIEEYVFCKSLESLLYRGSKVEDFHSRRANFGRLTASMMSSVRLYLDTVHSHSNAISSGSIEEKIIKSISAKEYDSSFCYRFMEALRNHVQHRSFPAHSFSFGQKSNETNSTVEYAIDFFFDIKKIDDKLFKESIRSELLASGEKVDLKLCVRSYFASICRMHEQFRSLFSEHKVRAEANIQNWRNEWLKKFPDSKIVGVAVCKFKGSYIDKAAPIAYIDPQIDEYRLSLVAKTFSVAPMEDRRVRIY